MDPQLSVLLYSKYSPMSKKLTAFMQGSQVDFTRAVSLQTLCIDNKQIRERIQKNEQLDITSVPCILVIFPDGGIEKYDGAHAFEWIEQIITKFTPPPQPVQPLLQQKMEEERWREEKRREHELIEKEREQIKLEREHVREEQRRKYEEHINRENPHESEGNGNHRRRRRIKPPSDDEGDDGGHTRIEDLDSDEDQKTSDRHRDRKPIAVIREDSGNYTRDDDLFPGSPTDMHRPKRSAVKGLSKNASEQKSVDLMSKAKELEKGRKESDPRPPPGHPHGKVV